MQISQDTPRSKRRTREDASTGMVQGGTLDGMLTVEKLRVLRAQQLGAHMAHTTHAMPLANEEGMMEVRPLELRQQRPRRLVTIACALLWVGVIVYAALTATPAPPHRAHHRDASSKMAALIAEQQKQRQQDQQPPQHQQQPPQHQQQQQQQPGGAEETGSSAAVWPPSPSLPAPPSPSHAERSQSHSPQEA